MQLLQVKGHIARITYNPTENHLLPSDFLLIEDTNQKLIAQIVNISTTQDININVADLRLILSIDKKDNLSYYNGYIPLKTASVVYIKSDEIVELIKSSGENIYIGNLSNHNDCFVKVPITSIDDRLYIQSDRYDKVKVLIQNLVSELISKGKKVIVLDFDGYYNNIPNTPRVKVTESFKLPLNAEAFSNILEYDIKDCPIEDIADIQSIVLELREYIKTVDNNFLPFTLFKTVIDNEYTSNPISGLKLLRNKLWLYAQENIFAESKNDFEIINKILDNQDILIIDASALDEKWYKFTLQTIQNLVNKKCYFVMSLNDIAADKKTITGLYNKSDIVPIISTSYESKYRQILKSLCKNQILFKPSKPVNDDEAYSYFLNRINSSEFILYGESALYIPLLLELQSFDSSTKDAVAQNEITKEVDKFFTSSKTIIPSQHPEKEFLIDEEEEDTLDDVQNNISIEENDELNVDLNDTDTIDDDVNDSDLDFLDSQNDEKITIDDLRKNKTQEAPQENSYDVFTPVEQSEDIEFITDSSESDNNDIEMISSEDITNNELTSDGTESQIENISDEDILFDDSDNIQNIDEDFSEKSDEIEIETKNDTLEEEIIPASSDSDFETINDEDILTNDDKPEDDIIPVEEKISETENAANKAMAQEEIFRPMGAEGDDPVYIPEEDIKEVKKEETVTEPEIKQEFEKELEIEPEKEPESDEINNTEDDITPIDDVINDIEDKASNSDEKYQETRDIENEEEKTPDAPPVNKDIKEKSSPELPYYETELSSDKNSANIEFKVGEKVFHPKHGKGVVKGFAQYKNTMYCRIEFEGEGYRILDPRVSALEKI